MSEYAARRLSDPVEPTADFLGASDASGTPSLFNLERDEPTVSGESSEAMITTDRAPSLEKPISAVSYPLTVLDRKAALTASTGVSMGRSVVAAERMTPYEELGGHRYPQEARDGGLNEVLRRYQPWMRDVAVGIERYGLLDMNPGDVDRMTVADRELLALYVDGFMSGLTTVKRLIAGYAELPTDHEFIVSKYNPHGERTKQELLDYRGTIDLFGEALKQKGVAGRLQQVAINRRPYPDKRHTARKSDKAKGLGTPRVIFDVSGKPRVERVSAQEA